MVDDVLWGCVTQLGDQSGNVGRFAVLAAGWPEHIPGVTINRACGSSQQAIEFAAMGVMSGRYDLVIAGGVESMSRVPLGATRAVGFPYGPGMSDRYPDATFEQGPGAEMMARQWRLVSRTARRVRTGLPPQGCGRHGRRSVRRPADTARRPSRA